MHSPARILVVEDDPLLRLVICEVLRDGYLEVVEVANADATLHYLKTKDSIDLIFTDVNMPGSMDALELAHAVNENFPEIKVVVNSGNTSASPTAPNPFIPKPYVVYDVLEKIKASL